MSDPSLFSREAKGRDADQAHPGARTALRRKLAANITASGLLGQRRARTMAYIGWIALTLVVNVLIHVLSWQGEVERHEQRLSTNATLGAKAINTYLVTLERAMTYLAEELRHYDDWSDATGRLAAFKKTFPEFQIVALSLPDGSSPANSEGPVNGALPNVGNEPAFQDSIASLRGGAGLVVERPFVGPVSGVRLNKLRLGVKDDQGNLIFTIAAGLAPERALNFWRDTQLPAETAMGLYRMDEYLIVRHPPPPADSPYYRDEPVPSELGMHLKALGHPRDGIFRGSSIVASHESMIAFQRLENYPLYFFVSDPTHNLRMQWWLSSWPFLVLILTLVFGGLFFIHTIGKQQQTWAAERERQMRELEALNDRLRSANAEMEAANAELNAFSYTVSHDLRAPIRAIDGFTAVLAEELGDSATPLARDMLSRVRANAGRMGELINDLLELSRLSRKELQLQDVDMQAEVASILEELAPLRGHATVTVGELPPARADRVLMRQVWSNLIVNAYKYSAHAPAPHVRIGHEHGAYFVEDNGAGFEMAYAGKLFQVFSRLHGEHEFSGTGVGLAIVRRVVERHGGGVAARGEVGKGARFSFMLPE